MASVTKLPTKDERESKRIRELLESRADLTPRGVEIAMEIYGRCQAKWNQPLSVSFNYPEGEAFTEKQHECIKDVLTAVKDHFTQDIFNLLVEMAFLRLQIESEK